MEMELLGNWLKILKEGAWILTVGNTCPRGIKLLRLAKRTFESPPYLRCAYLSMGFWFIRNSKQITHIFFGHC